MSADNTIQATQGDIATLYIVLQYPLEADPIVLLGGEAFAGPTGFDLLLADGTTYLEPDFVEMTLGADWRSSEEIGLLVDIVEFGRLLLQAYTLRGKAIAPLIRELQRVLLELAANYTNDILFQNNCAIGNLPDQTPWRTAPKERRRTTLIPGVDYLRFQGYRYAFPILFDESGSKTIDFIVRTGVSHNQSLLPQNLCATNAFNVNVAPNSGTIDIQLTGTVSGEVFIDGESVGTGSRLVGETPGTHTVTFGAVAGFVTPAPRTVTVSRDQTITVTGTYADNSACTYTMRRIDSPQTHPFDGGDDFSLQLETLGPQCQWSVTTDAPWITINGGLTGGVGGSPIIRYTVNESSTITPRTGHVIFQGNTSLESTITQAGAPCFIEIDPSELARTHDSGTDNGALSVYSPLGCSWAVKNGGALNDWLTLDLDTGGDGGGTILYALAENTTASTRTATIEIGDPTKPTVHRFTVTQLANTCAAPVLSSSATNIPSPTFTGSVLVTTDPGCSWSAESSASWLSIDPNTTSSISGGGVIYNVQQNPSTSSRVAALTIAEQTFTVTQDAE